MPTLSDLLRMPGGRTHGLLVPDSSQLLKAEGKNAAMTLGQFWVHVTTLVLVFDGRVTSGPRSTQHNAAVGGAEHSYHLIGLAADVVLAHWDDKDAFTQAAGRLGIRVIDEIEKKNHLHLQPK